MAELADAKDLGSFGNPVQVRFLLSAPNKNKTNLDENSKFVLFFYKRLFRTKNQTIKTLQPLTERSKRSVFLCRFAVLILRRTMKFFGFRLRLTFYKTKTVKPTGRFAKIL